MRKVMVLLIAVGLMISLPAYGATMQQSVKALASEGGRAIHSYSGEGWAFRACEDDGWVQDTPFGY